MTVVCICMGSRGKQLKVRACEMGTLSSCTLFLAEKQERISGIGRECLLVLAGLPWDDSDFGLHETDLLWTGRYQVKACRNVRF